jgi:hypothetical protein
MRPVLALVFLALALWRAAADWQATIAEGYAYRFGSLGALVSGRWPDGHASLVAALQRSPLPWAWDPVGAFLLSLPVALVLLALAAAAWVTRARPGSRR